MLSPYPRPTHWRPHTTPHHHPTPTPTPTTHHHATPRHATTTHTTAAQERSFKYVCNEAPRVFLGLMDAFLNRNPDKEQQMAEAMGLAGLGDQIAASL